MKLPASLWLVSALHVGAAGADDSGLHTLTIAAEIAAVAVGPQPAERHFFELPSLDYVFHVEARCHAGWKPESLSLNVADSLVTRTATQLADNADQRLELNVPAKQLAPIAMRDFCVIGAAAEGSATESWTPDGDPGTTPGDREMTIGSALSVHASLRCSLADEQRIVYVSQPLDVTLSCPVPETAGAGSPGG